MIKAILKIAGAVFLFAGSKTILYFLILFFLRCFLTSFRYLLFVLIIISVRHFQLGIQVILEDYVSDKNSRDFYIKLVNLVYFLLAIFGLFSITKIYFGVVI